MPIPSCKAALFAAADLILHDLGRIAQAYAIGTVTAMALKITRPFGGKDPIYRTFFMRKRIKPVGEKFT